MKPALSPMTTGVLPSRSASAETSSTTSCSVTTVRTTSTSLSTGAGLKKCIPTTFDGRVVATEISVTDSDEVLVARIVSARHTLSMVAKISCFRSSRSGTASMTRSTSARSSIEVLNRTRPTSASRSSSDSLPRRTARSVECAKCSRPRCRASSVGSTPTTCRPSRANTSAIPAPIVPRPTTPTVVKFRAIPRSSQVAPGRRGRGLAWEVPEVG